MAWATPNKVFEAAIEHFPKFQRFVVGIHGCRTSPACLKQLQGKPDNVVAVRYDPKVLFHPKLYIFEHDTTATVVIGSHNLTRAAFEKNIEVSTVSEFSIEDPVVQDLLAFVNEQARSQTVILSQAFLLRYEDLHRLTRHQDREIEDLADAFPVHSAEQARKNAPIYMPWNKWFDEVKADRYHGLDQRLQVLRGIGHLFRTYASFADMPTEARLRVVGLAPASQVQADGIDWNLFGNLRVAANFGNPIQRLATDDRAALSKALDRIPLDDPVHEGDWNAYFVQLRETFGKDGGVALGIATRLACVKRPDTFVPVNDANAKGLAGLLDRSQAEVKKAENYWGTVIAPIRLTPWWTHHPDPPPAGEELEAWKYRAALLDALVYVPKGTTASDGT